MEICLNLRSKSFTLFLLYYFFSFRICRVRDGVFCCILTSTTQNPAANLASNVERWSPFHVWMHLNEINNHHQNRHYSVASCVCVCAESCARLSLSDCWNNMSEVHCDVSRMSWTNVEHHHRPHCWNSMQNFSREMTMRRTVNGAKTCECHNGVHINLPSRFESSEIEISTILLSFYWWKEAVENRSRYWNWTQFSSLFGVGRVICWIKFE